MRITLPHEARANLDRRAAERGCSHARLSKLIGRAPDYVGRFIRDGVPTLLAPDDAALIADFLGISRGELGAIDNAPAPRRQRANRPLERWASFRR